jgi:class 3 adenylate cyclase/Flp pilus assembly protein TadD
MAQCKDLIAAGEYLRAYDCLEKALAESPDDRQLQYLSVLALVRSGAYPQARKLYDQFGLAALDNEDYLALGARLRKDAALADTTAGRADSLLAAARAYEAVFRKTHGDYPAVNAATLYLLAGHEQQAHLLAQASLAIADQQAPGQGLGEFYRLATQAEAKIVLGQGGEAHDDLVRAMRHAESNWSAVAGTRKQLSLMLSTVQAAGVLEPLTPPVVIHYCGHMMRASGQGGSAHPLDGKVIARAIARELARLGVGFGYGSLASGADILFAEALLERGAELNVVLPFDLAEFVDISVLPAGPDWVRRFERCLEQASQVTYATEDQYLDDAALFHFATRLGMGLAIQRARGLATRVEQLAVWDGEGSDSVAGTAASVAFWRGTSLPSTLLDSRTGELREAPEVIKVGRLDLRSRTRHPKAMLFGDIQGFSKLKDAELPVFVDHVLSVMGEVLSHHADDILFSNTWGDGLFVVLDGVVSAARCAIDLQQALQEVELRKIGLPEHLMLRLAGHHGPVYELSDPVLRRTNYFGSHVSRAARIEPVTPPGEVYVTRHFAAELAFDPQSEFATDYVGIMPTAKSFGELPMYILRKTH